MEPENHKFEKENHLPKPPFLGSMLVFRGVHCFFFFRDQGSKQKIFIRLQAPSGLDPRKGGGENFSPTYTLGVQAVSLYRFWSAF